MFKKDIDAYSKATRCTEKILNFVKDTVWQIERIARKQGVPSYIAMEIVIDALTTLQDEAIEKHEDIKKEVTNLRNKFREGENDE